MKIQCQLCKEIVEIGPFRVVDGDAAGIHVDCTACSGTFFVDAREPRAGRVSRAVALDGPTMTCPKCDAEQAEAEACSQCGLRAERFDDYAGAAEEQHEDLAALFAECEASWGDDDAHERFVAAVSNESAFAYGAKRYRSVARERPGDATADRQLDRLARMAEVKLVSASYVRRAEDEVKEPYKAVVIMIIVLVVVLGIGGYYLFTLKSKTGNNEATVPNVTPSSSKERKRIQSSKRRGITRPPRTPQTPTQPDKK